MNQHLQLYRNNHKNKNNRRNNRINLCRIIPKHNRREILVII